MHRNSLPLLLLLAAVPWSSALAQEPIAENDAVASEELETLRALEEVAIAPTVGNDALVLQMVRQLGPAHPLRMRLEDALGELDLRDDAPLELSPVSDVLAFDVSLIADRYDIPVEMHASVAQYIQFFQGPGRKWFRKWVERSTRYLPVMQPILEEHGVPKDTVYLAMIESGFSPQAYSWAHAAGPWQFIEGTGRQYGLKLDFWVDERRDPIKSTHAAAKFLKQLHSSLGHWYLAWAGYNTGGGRVRKLVEKKGTTNFWELADGRGLAKETKNYVPKLIAAALVTKHPTAFGFDPAEFQFQAPLEWDEVKLPDAVDIAVIANAAGTTEEEIRELNPELRRWSTPPASEEDPYVLRLPKGRAPLFTENLEKIPKSERFKFAGHVIERGDTLSHIAVKYDTSIEAIMRMNGIKSATALRIGQVLMIPIPGGGSGHPKSVERAVAQARRSSGTPRSRTEPAGDTHGRTRVKYSVKNGDTLWAISQRFGCSVEDLRKWNGFGRGRRLQIGEQLTVWQPRGKSAPPRVGSGVHVLAAGESLWSVAQRYGVSVEDLKRWNDIRDHLTLATGLKLRVSAP